MREAADGGHAEAAHPAIALCGQVASLQKRLGKPGLPDELAGPLKALQQALELLDKQLAEREQQQQQQQQQQANVPNQTHQPVHADDDVAMAADIPVPDEADYEE
eukprot:323575-Pyramimonas_sp.AAC.1